MFCPSGCPPSCLGLSGPLHLHLSTLSVTIFLHLSNCLSICLSLSASLYLIGSFVHTLQTSLRPLRSSQPDRGDRQQSNPGGPWLGDGEVPGAESEWMRGGDQDQKRLLGGGDACVSGSGDMTPELEGGGVCVCFCIMCVPVEKEEKSREPANNESPQIKGYRPLVSSSLSPRNPDPNPSPSWAPRTHHGPIMIT